MWQCPKVGLFWDEVKRAVETIISKDVPKDPVLFILGINGKYEFTKSEQVNMCFLQAKRTLAIFWGKKVIGPSWCTG